MQRAVAVINANAVTRLATAMRARYRTAVPLEEWASPPAELAVLLAALQELGAIAAERVAAELRPLVASLNARRKTCYRCATEAIGKVQPKRRQRSFCSSACSAAQRQEDFFARRSRVT